MAETEIVRRLEALEQPADTKMRMDAAAEIMRLRRLLLQIKATAALVLKDEP